MSSNPDADPTVFLDEPLDAEEVALEPAVAPEPSRAAPSAHAAVVRGPAQSLASATGVLLRDRLRSAASFFAVAYGMAWVWNMLTGAEPTGIALALLTARLALVGGVLYLLSDRRAPGPDGLRRVESLLFGGLTACLILGQFLLDRLLIAKGDLPTLIAREKNGVIELLILMIVYGMFIPSDAKRAARVILTMALAPLVVLALLMESSGGRAGLLERLGTPGHAGQNALIVLAGAGLGIYGARVLNRLRAEVHEARRFGQYRLTRKLGEGGMGEVHLAEHQLLKRPCALKLIRADAGADPLALARFEREVRSAAQLSHPNTIAIYDYGHTEDGTFYYVMEYLEGLTLSELVEQFGPLPAARVIHLFRQVCAGLAEAHALGLVHRDLKPANLFVAIRGGEFDVAKVLDFGLVKTRDPSSPRLTADQTVSGTPLYMAPEQAAGEDDLDARADIYALGACAYFALTGQPPFSGTTAFAVLVAAARDPVVPPSQVRPDVPADLEEVVLRCLAKTPQERYPDVRALAQALASCASATDWDTDRAETWWASQAHAKLQEEPAGLAATP